MLAVGTQLGRYEVLGSIGAGGMGEVYRARDLTLDRIVAIKVLPEHFTSDPARLARFQSEVKALAALSHPNILSIFDVGSERGVHFAVMELLVGETLRERLGQAPFSWRKAVEIAAAIADGLAAAHARGIVHRDLKPDNLFLSSDGQVKILDFGLARIDQAASPSVETGPFVPDQTETGTVMGTVGYMSPEQIRGRVSDGRSDIFALGCVLHEMIAGRRAFARDTHADILAATLHDETPELPDTVPLEVRRIIRHCLEKSPDERFQSARDVAFDLRAAMHDSAIVRPIPVGKRPWRSLAFGFAAIIAAAVLSIALSRHYLGGTQAPNPTIESLAVLPFQAPGQDTVAQEIGEGIPDGIIKKLYTLKNLKVRPFSSVLAYKDKERDLQRIRTELSVQAVLDGRITRRAAESLLISVELIDLRDNSIIWAERYQREVTVAFAVQEEILREIARQLRLHLSQEEEQQLVKHHTEDAEAFQLYVKGRQHFNSAASDSDIDRAIQYFEQARDRDPNYAMAYAGLAECYYWLSNIYKPPSEVIPQGKAAAQKAISLDETNGEAHGMLGLFLAVYDWDFPASFKEFRRAVELNPNSSSVRTYYGLALANNGQFPESLAELRLARELDPSAIFNQLYAVYPLYFAREHRHAIKELEHLVEINPDHFLPAGFLGLNYEQTGEYDKAIAAFKRTIELSDVSEPRTQLAHVYAKAGKEPEARSLLQEVLEMSQQRYVSPYNVAVVYVGLGELDTAFEWFERAVTDRSEWFGSLNVDPRLDPIRDDPRFIQLTRHLKTGR